MSEVVEYRQFKYNGRRYFLLENRFDFGGILKIFNGMNFTFISKSLNQAEKVRIVHKLLKKDKLRRVSK